MSLNAAGVRKYGYKPHFCLLVSFLFLVKKGNFMSHQRKFALLLASSLIGFSLSYVAPAQDETKESPPVLKRKPCEELKAEIDAKLQAKGVTAYTLEIVPNEDVGDQKVVGSCDGGTKKITYKRN
jgi:Protein of unknown function (DUF1161)